MDSRRRARLTQTVRAAVWLVAASIALAAAAGCNSDDGSDGRKTRDAAASASQREGSREYRVARTVRAFLVAFTEGDGQAACRLMTRQRQAELIERSRRPTCERAVVLQVGAARVSDLERLARAKVSKVALAPDAATAEVLTPAQRGRSPASHTVRLTQIDGRWRIASDFFRGALSGGKIPTPPPPPPRNPAQERAVAAVFERFRQALERGDGKSACALRTPAAQRAAVSQAIQAAGGKEQALSDYGKLTCAAVSAGLRIPDETVRKVTVTSPTEARVTLDGGAIYDFKKLRGAWSVDT